MKTYLLIAFALISGFTKTEAQNVTYKTTALEKPKHSYYYFMGMDDKFIYYRTSLHTYTKFNKSNLKDYKDIEYTLSKEDSGWVSHYLHGNSLFVVSSHSRTNNLHKLKTTTYRLYKFKLQSGEKEKDAKFEVVDSSKFYYNNSFDSKVEKFFIKRSDSIVKAFNIDLEGTDDLSKGVHKYQPALSFGFSDMLKDLMKSFNLKFNITISGDDISSKEEYKDSTSMDNYTISFNKRKDEDIHYFKSTLQGVVINSKLSNNKVKSVDFSIDADKNIIDINYRENNDGKILLFGKYIVKGKTKSQYGMFSVVYSKDLNEVAPVKYFDLNTFYNITDSEPNLKYVGFIFSKLFNPDYEFHIEDDGIFIFTYQKSYSNIQDHIYLFKIESNGQITVNMIVNRLLQKTKSGYNEKHLALLSGKKVHILFYDHKDCIGREIRDLEYTNGNIDKKSCVLLTTTYDIEQDEFTKKTLIADRKTLKYLPNFVSPVIYYDENLNQYNCLIEGLDKKRKTVIFYEFMYTK